MQFLQFLQNFYSLNWGLALFVFAGSVILMIALRSLIASSRDYIKFKHANLANEIVFSLSKVSNLFILFLSFYLGILQLNLQLNPQLYVVANSTVLIIIFYELITKITAGIENYSKKLKKEIKDQETSTIVSYMSVISKTIIWALGAFFILENIGFDISALITGLGISGFAIAFALRSLIKDMISSVVIFLEKPIKIGDRIKVNKNKGIVQKVGIKSTILKLEDGKEIVLPNSFITDKAVKNYKQDNSEIMSLTLTVKNNKAATDITNILKQALLNESIQSIDPNTSIHINSISEEELQIILVVTLLDATTFDEQSEYIAKLLQLTLEDNKISFISLDITKEE